MLAGEAIGLPSRFFVVGYVDVARQFMTAGQTVPESVVAGPHGVQMRFAGSPIL